MGNSGLSGFRNYEITRHEITDPTREVTVIKGRRFPTCRGCKGVSFVLVHAAKHVHEVEHFDEETARA